MEQAIQFERTGLDLDSNLASMNPGDSPLRINCRVNSSQDSNKGGVQNFKGNTLIQKKYGGGIFVQPNGNNQVIGSCKDVERDAIIYFVWNSLGNHQIRRYFTADNSIQLIMQSPLLNFKRTHKITHADVINDILCWTDGWINPFDEFDYNPPRQIDINKAIGNTEGFPWPVGYPTIDNQVLDAIKYAPGLNPTFNYVDDTNFQDNRLYGHLFQFGYRWIYFDNSRSVVSPLSKLTLPQGENIEGDYELQVENRIDVTVKTGHFTVVRIELVVKDNNAYRVVDSVEKYDSSGGILIPSNSDYIFGFFNNKFISTISAEEALRPFDYVPQCSGAQALLKSQVGARRVLSRNLEGYANVPDFDMSVEVGIEKINPTGISLEGFKKISLKRKGSYQAGVVYSDGPGRKSFVQTNENAKTTIPWWYNEEIIQQYYDPADEWILSTSQKPFISWQLNSTPPSWATSYQIVCTNDLNQQQRLYTFEAFGACVGDDKNGQWGVDTNTIYIPPQVGYDFLSGDRIRLVAAYDRSENPNVPKFGMVGYVNGGNDPKKLGDFVELVSAGDAFQAGVWGTYGESGGVIWDVPIISFDAQTQRAKLVGNGLPFADFSDMQKGLFVFEIYNPAVQINSESEQFFEIGECYPIVDGEHSVTSGTIDGVDVFVTNQMYKLNPSPYRYQVKSFFGPSAAPSPIQDIDINTSLTPTTGSGPSKAILKDYVFMSGFCASYIAKSGARVNKTVSVVNALEKSGSLEGANTTYGVIDGTFQFTFALAEVSVSATGRSEGAQQSGDDTTLTMTSPCRTIEMKGIIFESHSYSPFYQSDVNQNGRPYVINKEATRRNNIADNRYGGAVIDNSSLNFFSTYYADDVVKLSESYNEITRIQVSGDTLKVRQVNKSTSIYVDRTETMNADGSSNLLTADKVLGTTNSSVEVWGGTNGATDQMAVRDTYFFDAINGVVVRDAVNGLIAVSGNKESAADTFKMTSFFRDMGNYVRNNQQYVDLHSVYDENTECYILTLKYIGREEKIPDFLYKYKVQEAWNNGFTVCFNEPSNRWETFHHYVPEWYGTIGNTLLAFLDGDAYLMYSNEKHNNYFGVQYDTVCGIQSNQKPYTNNIRVYDNIDVYSNDIWFAQNSPDGEDIYILPSSNNPTGMVSELSPEVFNAKEGVYHASFLHNKRTLGFNNGLLALMCGDQLRGQSMKIILRNTSEKSVFMRQVIVHTTRSEMSG